jgi:ABC-type transport system involved in cytochrome c biogenesis permease subunit
MSWGRYWGWDPKETWALITMLVYALPLHTQAIAWLRRPLVFHVYMAAAFLFVLFTYFGVNHFLGGLHSYA